MRVSAVAEATITVSSPDLGSIAAAIASCGSHVSPSLICTAMVCKLQRRPQTSARNKQGHLRRWQCHLAATSGGRGLVWSGEGRALRSVRLDVLNQLGVGPEGRLPRATLRRLGVGCESDLWAVRVCRTKSGWFKKSRNDFTVLWASEASIAELMEGRGVARAGFGGGHRVLPGDR